jgi:hypothetical protein
VSGKALGAIHSRLREDDVPNEHGEGKEDKIAELDAHGQKFGQSCSLMSAKDNYGGEGIGGQNESKIKKLKASE